MNNYNADFKNDLVAIFGEERLEEFPEKLVDMLYLLWREGFKRGKAEERGRQIDSLDEKKAKIIKPERHIMEEMAKQMTKAADAMGRIQTQMISTPTPHQEMFKKVLAGEEPLIKTEEKKEPFKFEWPYNEPKREYEGRWQIQLPSNYRGNFFSSRRIPVKKTKL